MKASSIAELKAELKNTPPSCLAELCLQLAKYKKENKELLTYLLFDADDEENYKSNVKDEVVQIFSEMNHSQFYLAKKTIRKALRVTQKYIKYSGNKQTEVELLMHFCFTMRKSGLRFEKSLVLANLFLRQVQKLEKAIASLHDDLQYDYRDALRLLRK